MSAEVRTLEQAQPAALAEHLVRLPGTDQWALWRWVGLRGAGFPAALVLRLAAPDCAAAADQLLAVEDDAERTWQLALDTLRGAVDTAAGAERQLLVKALRRLNQAEPVRWPEAEVPLVSEDVRAPVQEFATAYQQVEAVRGEYERTYESSAHATGAALQEMMRSGPFREAITWQNRRALHTGIDAFLRKQPGTNSSKHRQHQELAASYVQRYCTKNDSIGFFGPVGWARITDEADSLSVRPGPSLLASREVYFESWCLEALCQALAEDGALRQWLIPQRFPYVRQEGQWLYLPAQDPVRLSPAQASVLSACDGERTASQIARELQNNDPLNAPAELAVFELLESLRGSGFIAWPAGLPYGSHPEQEVHRRFDRIGENSLRSRATTALAELESARDEIAVAAGDADRLDTAFAKLEKTFHRLTSVASTRAEGKTYAGRTLVYEDCRRDVEVEISLAILENLGPPLSLLLSSARWLTFQFAEEYRKALRHTYDELAREKQTTAVEAVDYWTRAQRLLFGRKTYFADDVATGFQERWTEIFSLPEGQQSVEYTSDELRSRVSSAFSVPRRGWQCACYHSPDVMIAADSVEAIRRGDYQLVLGEVHVAMNTLSWSFFLAQHPSPAEFFQAIDRDLASPRAVVSPPKSWPGLTSRNFNILKSSKDFSIEFASDSAGEQNENTLPIASLVVEERDGELLLRTRDGRVEFEIVEAFADLFSGAVVDFFKLLKPAEHLPRVTIDRLVVQRESWSLPAAEADFAFHADESSRFLDARRWAHSHGLPRHVFIKVPVETKPLFIDFASPVLLEMLAKLLRRSVEQSDAATVTVTEMLPGMEQLWLVDHEGERYTSELRLVAVDLLN